MRSLWPTRNRLPGGGRFRSGVEAIVARYAIRQLKQSFARLFRKSLCNLIPRIERLLQGEVRFDSLLDLVQRETEFSDGLYGSPRRE